MNIKSKSSTLQGVFQVPSDKSISHRALMLSSIASSPSYLQGILWGEDIQATSTILRQLGCNQEISYRGDSVDIYVLPIEDRQKKPKDTRFNCGNSGTTMRLMMGLLSSSMFSFELFGDASLSKRPMKRIVEPLANLGIFYRCKGREGRPPIIFQPNTRNQTSEVPFFAQNLALPSAQLKSALLLCGLQYQGCEIKGGLYSRNHTEIMLEKMGADIMYPKNTENSSQSTFQDDTIILHPSQLTGLNCHIPKDQSSAAFAIAAALITPDSKLELRNINFNSTRTGFLDHVIKMGADIEVFHRDNTEFIEPVVDLIVKYSPNLQNREIQEQDVPRLIDEIPILALLATQAEGVFEISFAEELRVKETDRIAATVSNFQKLGVEISEKRDGFRLLGKQEIQGGEVFSFSDHRIAMTSILAGMISKKSVLVRDVESIHTSFPNFFTEFRKCGANLDYF